MVRTAVAASVLVLCLSASTVSTALNGGVEAIAPERLFPDARFDPAVPSPDRVLGVGLGRRPLRPAEVVAYLRALAEASPLATIVPYATSHEGRPLVALAISDAETIAGLDAFREAHLRALDPRGRDEAADRAALDGAKAVAWMAYGIHGDELSSVDAAVALAYRLVAGTDERARALRSDLVILVDPCENPDGRERYLAMTTAFAHAGANPDSEDLSHTAVWPWGRGNHYLFDLNRDWFTRVQPESGRSAAIAGWLPQLVVDSHEMEADSTYLFPPARAPFNPFLGPHHVEWWNRFSADQARALDALGFPYFTREWNEEFFPGYGSSWASYHGGVGILYEMSRTSGTLVRKRGGTLRTFAQAIEHQTASSMANLETLRENRAALLRDQVGARRAAVRRALDGPFRAYVFPADPRRPARLRAFGALLASQGIEVRWLAGPVSLGGLHDLRSGAEVRLDLAPGSLAVPLDQPAGSLARVVLDPHVPMPASFLREEREYLERGRGTRLYDTTAWSLPLLAGIDAYWTSSPPGGSWAAAEPPRGAPASPETAAGAVALVLDADPDAAAAALAAMLADGVTVRVAKKPFRIGAREFGRGAMVVRLEGNPEDVVERVRRAAGAHGLTAVAVGTSRAAEGPDLGGAEFPVLVAPRIGVLTGMPVSPSAYGAIWHLLDAVVATRFSGLDVARLRGADLARYNVLVLPAAFGGPEAYARALGPDGVERLRRWVEAGGTAVGIASGARFLAAETTGLTKARMRAEALDAFPPAVLGITAEEAEAAGPMRGAGLRPPPEPEGEGGNAPSAKKDRAKPEPRTSPYDVAPRIGAGAAPFVAGVDLGTPVSGPPVPLASWLRPTLPAGRKEPTPEEMKGADARLRRFMPQGALLRVDLDPEQWLVWGLGEHATAWVGEDDTLVAVPPVDVPARFAALERLHLGGLLWPEAEARIAETAYVTREAVGRGQVVLFADSPAYRGWMRETSRMLENAVLLGPGLGTDWSAPW